MKDKKILFITYDLSGYYSIIEKELKNQFTNVECHNIVDLKKFKYKSLTQRLYLKTHKFLNKINLKNYYKLQPIIESTENKTYDYILIVRPDLFFDSQLAILKSRTKNFIAYYHDSINNIPRKKEVIPFFDKVYAYEKKDVQEHNLSFLSNFIYLDKKDTSIGNNIKYDAFTVISKDYRLDTVEKLASYFKEKKISYNFLVHYRKEVPVSPLVNHITDRQSNIQVLEYINQCKVIVDIHKYGIQDGLTFRVFESLFFEKKLITTNADIKTYDFYNPSNIHVIEPHADIDIPEAFFTEPYVSLPSDIYQKYNYKSWIKTILS